MMLRRFIFLLLFTFTISCLAAVVKVSEVDFQGNTAIESKNLLSSLTLKPGLPFDSEILKADTDKLLQYYQKLGYFQAIIHYPQVIPLNAESVKIVYQIEENGKSTISQLSMKGNHYFPLPKLQGLLGFTNDTTWDFAEINQLLQQITDLYTSRGYLFASVSMDSLEQNKSGYTAYITIEEGKLCHITNYQFQGNKTTKPTTLLKLSGLDQVDLVTPNVISQAEENIRSKQYIKNCSIIPINESTLLITVEEDKMTRIAGVIGYNNANVSSSQRVSGNLQFQFLNLYGTDRNLTFQWYQIQNQHQNIELSYHDSGPFKFPIAGNIYLYREQADSTWIKTRLTLNLYYYSLYHQVGINLATDDVYPGSRRPPIIANDHEKTIGVFWKFSNVDYSPNPGDGMSASVNLDEVFVDTDSLSTKRNAVAFTWNNYQTFARKFVWFLGINGKTLSDHSAPYYRLFYLGGFNTLRGFTENSFAGWRIGWVNSEFRLRTGRDSRIQIFVDYGFVELQQVVQQIKRDKILDNLFGTGLGLRINTRLGVVGIDYALGYNGHKWTSPLDGIIHFGLDTKF
jgi:outer membrane protein assembly factor BamA